MSGIRSEIRVRISSDVKEMEKLGETKLAPISAYVKYGVHIGTNKLTKDMRRFVYKKKHGVWLLNIIQTDERLRLAARLLSLYDSEDVAVFASRLYAQKPALKFSKYTGFKCFVGRATPGTLTNPALVSYTEPEIILITDPAKERHIIEEANLRGIPIIALVDTNNTLSWVDFAVPSNNKGRKALAFVFWLLTNAILREKGLLQENQTIDETPESFMVMLA